MGADAWLDEVAFDAAGLIPAIAQDASGGRILMFAWMNREALALTRQTGFAHYWSRSRGKLWRKGEESGHLQKVAEIRLDCDEDVILLLIDGRQCLYHGVHTPQQSLKNSEIDNPRGRK